MFCFDNVNHEFTRDIFINDRSIYVFQDKNSSIVQQLISYFNLFEVI